MCIHTIIDKIKSEGFEVYGPKDLTSYVYFTDGTRIGYAQWNRLEGETYATVHKANRETGTGFRADSMGQALCFAPSWAWSSQLGSVVKFKDFDTFSRAHWQPLVQY